MSTRRIVYGVVAATVTMFVVGYLIWGIALADFFASNTGSATGLMKDPPVFWALGVGQLGFGGLLTLVLGRRAAVSGVGGGLKVGGLVGLFMGVGVYFTFYATMNTANFTATLANAVLVMVQTGIAGAVVGAIVGKTNPGEG